VPDLEERVAALEEAILHPPQRIVPSVQPLTEAEAGEFRERFAEAVRPLSPGEIRQLLSECVTVVKPGETLIVRVPVTWNPEQVSNYQKNFNDWAGWLDLPFRVIVVIGDGLGIAEPQP